MLENGLHCPIEEEVVKGKLL